MSKYLESTIITEIKEIRNVMENTTETQTLDRLNQSISLNRLDQDYNPDDIFYYAIKIYEDEEVKIYKGSIESDAFDDDLFDYNKIAAIERIKNSNRQYIYDDNNPDVLMFTKDFLD
jgi:hypothetical protein